MSTLKVNYLISRNSIILNFNGETHNVLRSSPLSDSIIQALKDGNHDEIPDLVDKSKAVKKFSNNEFDVVNGVIKIGDFEVPQVLSDKILEFMDSDLPYQPLVEFSKNLLDNPSNTALNSLYRFLEHNNHPITEDGHFIAYKRVRKDFKDIYSGTFDNSPGQVVKVARNQVDEDVNNTCSHGLHVANWEYANSFYGGAGDTMLEVKVNPAHVVAVPRDYNNAKMRVCQYEVLGVVQNAHEEGELLRNTCDNVSSCNNSCYSEDNYDDEDDWDDEYDSDNDWDEEDENF